LTITAVKVKRHAWRVVSHIESVRPEPVEGRAVIRSCFDKLGTNGLC